MSDLISRQAAIDALRYAQHRFTVADEAGGMGTVKWSEDVIYFAAAERVLSELPSAQPEERKESLCKKVRALCEESKIEFFFVGGGESTWSVTNDKHIKKIVECHKAQLLQERTEERTESHACDLISRQAAIEAIDRLDIPEDMCVFEILSHIELEIGNLPPAQPEQKWIPCSERLPGEHEWLDTKKFGTTISNEVYVTFEAPDGQRFAKHISFQNGKLSPVDEQRMKVWFKGAKPIAWMPLPEPYREERTEE